MYLACVAMVIVGRFQPLSLELVFEMGLRWRPSPPSGPELIMDAGAPQSAMA